MVEERVFLGGTTADSTWREELIEMLDVESWNPIVKNWDEEAYQNELRQREVCRYCLYTITPKMQGVYSIAEVVDDSNKRPRRTIFCVLDTDRDLGEKPLKFNESQLKSLKRVGEMVVRNGGQYFTSLEDVANYINDQHAKRTSNVHFI